MIPFEVKRSGPADLRLQRLYEWRDPSDPSLPLHLLLQTALKFWSTVGPLVAMVVALGCCVKHLVAKSSRTSRPHSGRVVLFLGVMQWVLGGFIPAPCRSKTSDGPLLQIAPA